MSPPGRPKGEDRKAQPEGAAAGAPCIDRGSAEAIGATPGPRDALDPQTLPLRGRQLIEASAGTGKTYTLTQLFLRLVIERGLLPRQILVVTYTEAATAELKERLRAELARRARDASLDDELRRRLRTALQDFDEAAITTIHGFCRQALGELPFTAGAPLALQVLEDESALRLQVVQDHWRSRVAALAGTLPAAAATALAATLLQHRDSPEAWEPQLRRALANPMVRWVWPPGMDTARLDDDAARQSLDEAHTALHRAFTAARATWSAERALVVDIAREARPRLDSRMYKPESLEQAFADWDVLLSATEPLQVAGTLEKLHLLGRAKFKALKQQAAPQAHVFFDQAQALLDRAQAMLAADSSPGLTRLWLLRELLEQGPARLAALKHERRLQSFDDMLANLHQRLQGARGHGLAAALRARFPAALIDEFQDTDRQQAAIFDAIYRDHPDCPVLMLGDPKQAIYGFRGADLHTYLQARRSADACHTLVHNQRSTGALLRALNALYATHPGAFVIEGLSYTPVEEGAKRKAVLHDPRGLLGDGALQLWLLPRGDDGQPLLKRVARARAAGATAARIAELLQQAGRGELTLTAPDGDPRALCGGDIAVLVRSHREGALMRQALSARGVASIELSQQSVHASAEADELLRVLAAMLEPTRTPLLHAALATVLMGHDAASLQALQHDEPALQAVIERFQAHHRRWLQRGAGVMLRHWMQAEGVAQRLLALPEGDRRLTNLLHLAERLQQHERAAPGAPAAQLRWLREQSRQAATGGDDREASLLRLESDRQLVQIVTLHRAKGLEYPLVFCPFAWDLEPPTDRLEGLAYHDDDGRAVLDYRAIAKTDPLRQRVALERRAETMRLLYVGLTRAVHRCVLTVGCHISHRSIKPAARGALNSLVAGGELSPAQWLENACTADDIDAAWRAYAARAAPDAELRPWPAADLAAAKPVPTAEIGPLAALPPPAAIAPAWTLASYSSLWLNLRHERAAADHDLTDTDAAATAPVGHGDLDDADPAALADDDFLRFPRGAAAGEALHALFERIDFTQPSGWPAIVDEVLARHALAETPDDAAAPAGTQAARVLTMLHHTLGTPLAAATGSALRLRTVPPARRLVELAFFLPAPRLDLQALAALMRDAGLGDLSLATPHLDGYLRGFIDLVVEHEGRWWIIDWKSNHLGHRAADYDGPALDAAMRAHGYTLQALLYAVALHRWLARRLRGYAPERHFGGVHYLFLRGLRPDWPGAGVHSWRPEPAVLKAASALFGAGES